MLSIAGFFALVYGIIQAGTDGWTAPQYLRLSWPLSCFLTAFIIWELKSPDAMLPINFFKNMSFTGANISLTLVTFGMFGSFFFLGQYLQTVQNYTPLQAGVRLLPMALVSFISAAVSARIANRIGTKITVSLGILIAAIGFFYLASIAAVNTGYGQLSLAMCITALGIGLVMSPGTNSVMGSVPVNQAGVGSAMSNTTRQIGGALGVAVLGTLLNSTCLPG